MWWTRWSAISGPTPTSPLASRPEGTRKYVEKWKSGFWHIARKAEVPLILTSFDYGRKEVIFREPYFVGDDVEKDMAWIQNYFTQFKGRTPSMVSGDRHHP